jgi:hypothetical protein
MFDLEVLQDSGSVELVHEQVAEVGHGDTAGAGPVAPDPQRNLLGHDSGGEERRRLGAEQPGHLGLQPRYRAALAVAVPLVDAELAASRGQALEDLGRALVPVPRHDPRAGPGGSPHLVDQVLVHPRLLGQSVLTCGILANP